MPTKKPKVSKKLQPRHFPPKAQGAQMSTNAYVRAYYQLNAQHFGGSSYPDLLLTSNK